MSLLQEYNIDKKNNSAYKLKFTTVANTEVSYSYDRGTNINTVTLTTGSNNKTKFSQDFKSVNGKLHINFNQVNGTLRGGGGKPVIIIDDQDGGGL